MTAAAWVCLFSPLAAAVLITLGGTRLPRRLTGYLATASVAVAFVAAVVDFFAVIGRSDSDQQQVSTAWTWLSAGSFNVGLSVLVDPLSVLMMLIVTGVGALIVGYSIGYMDGEDEERRYFAYMALFVFSMLLLVQGGNLLMLLIGWGLVGLSSYLLIGFYHQRPQAVAAAKKAFIMNAFGDATMVLAFFLLIQRTGSLSFQSSFDWAGGETGTWAVNLVALGLLGGAVAKSAQLPLQTWLPDAMEGPTPVSALIHAATMVTAGVYLLVRTAPIFEAAKHVQELAAGLGAATLLIAGLIALVQTDIKRVIAYSTMSQIGYMFLGAGLGAYANAMFLLMAHAFFKALLFLAAGIVIHALAGEQDMRRMGGLRRYLPNTYWAFVIGALALAGIPPLSGFFAKDSILASALAAGTYGQILFVVGVLGTFLTGLYAFRMVFLVFGGEPSPFVQEHLHRPDRSEPWLWMGAAVAVLSVLSVIGGWVQIPGVMERDHELPRADRRVGRRGRAGRRSSSPASARSRSAWPGSPSPGPCSRPARCASRRHEAVRTVLEHKFYFDELYDAIFYRPTVLLAVALRDWFERPLILGSLGEIGAVARKASSELREVQTGLVRTYALAIAGSVTVLAFVFVWVK